MKQKVIEYHPTIEGIYIEDIKSLSELIDKCVKLQSKGIELITVNGSGYDGELTYAYIVPLMEREETDYEYSRRQIEEFERAARYKAMAEQQEQRDIREYERLKKKFEGK